jgi:hypothetical protein
MKLKRNNTAIIILRTKAKATGSKNNNNNKEPPSPDDVTHKKYLGMEMEKIVCDYFVLALQEPAALSPFLPSRCVLSVPSPTGHSSGSCGKPFEEGIPLKSYNKKDYYCYRYYC